MNPLRLSLDRFWLYGACCALVTSVPFIALGWFRDVAYKYDFACFWSAGANVGTPTLTDPMRLYAWAKLHHMIAQPFSYPPAFAYLYAPFSHLPPLQALAIEELVMTGLFIAAALIAARIYGFSPWFSIAAVLAWGPSVSAIETGQNTGIALCLAFLTGWALIERRDVVAGVAVGLLLYKPTLAVPLLVLLAARKQWRALAIVAVCGLGWYLLSVSASGGDWRWPATYIHTISWWLPMDFAVGAAKAFTLPTVLLALGATVTTASLAGAVLLALSIPAAARTEPKEAASMMPLVGLAASVHAWPYDAALALPAIFYAMATWDVRVRTVSIAILYVLAAIGIAVKYGTIVFAILCVGGTALWISAGYRTKWRNRLARSVGG